MTSKEIRKQFLDFFAKKEHRIIESAPVVPFDDPTLLFINAGMNQFKDVFLGKGKRDYNRVANTQKCIRVSGKHNDLEEVGRDTYHHTFFEMLGNWSLGDPNNPEAGYYKKEAITWAWELLTQVWKLPKKRLWATVYRTDDEAMEIWKNQTDINPAHILRFDEKDNFWEMGETGPCGPCSEIHINLGDDYDNPKWVNAGVEECIEIWNLVFIQYNRDAEGNLHDLPAKHVDTGMGFERIVAVLQNKKSNYETDVFTPVINKIAEIADTKYEGEENIISMRVIADHIRTLTFAIADGATPGNEGRGYVLRRILRRAARFGRKINLTQPFMFKLVDVLINTMGDVFPEIVKNRENIEKIIKAEEESFNKTLDRGIELFEQIAQKVKAKKTNIISGDDVFKLYDTYGFPVDLTNIMAEEKGLSIDEARFNKLMAEQRQRARNSTKSKISEAEIKVQSLNGFTGNTSVATEFIGYTQDYTEATLLAIKETDEAVMLLFDKTPFYVESGGQVNDTGFVIKDNRKYDVVDVFKIDDKIIHVVKTKEKLNFNPGEKLKLSIDKQRRMNIKRNHSATHLMHSALRKILGEHVKQAGSYVGPERLRFDFSHYQKVTDDEIKRIEREVNEKICESLPVTHHINIPFEKAKEMGALMFFGDKYGDSVNVIQFGNYSMEFCGGTHVNNTSEIGIFKIVSESSVASGTRRIEAITCNGVEKYIYNQEKIITELKAKLNSANNEKRKLEKEIAEFELKIKLGAVDEIIKNSEIVSGINLIRGKVSVSNMDELKQLGDNLRNKIKSGVGIIISDIGKKVGIVAVVSDDLIKEKKLQAGKIVGAIAKLVGGGGGGRPHLATAGGRDISKIDYALEATKEILTDLLE